MPCPYAERKGTLVVCKVRGTPVNPLAYPCLGEKYANCPIYAKAERETAIEEAKEAKPAAPVTPAPTTAPSPPTRRGSLGMTRAGEKPGECGECVFYSKSRRWCFILGTSVNNPALPPCG